MCASGILETCIGALVHEEKIAAMRTAQNRGYRIRVYWTCKEFLPLERAIKRMFRKLEWM